MIVMGKKLSQKAVKENVKSLNHVEVIDFTDDITVKLRPLFNNDDIERCLEKFQANVNTVLENELEWDDRLFWHLVNYNAIRQFSDISTPKNQLTDIQFFYTFIQSDYYTEIMSYISDDELAKVYEKVFKLFENLDKFKNMQEKQREEILTMDIENDELRNKIQGKQKQIPEV